MDETEQYMDYLPSHAQNSNKSNDSIAFRSNIQYDSLAGNSFSNTKNSMNFSITDDTMLVTDSLKLSSKFNLVVAGGGAMVGDCKFNGSAYSLIKSIQVFWGGQCMVNITQNGQYITQNNVVMHLSQTEYAQHSLTALEDVELTTTGDQDFELNLDVYGLIKKFLPTGLANFDVKITLESDLAKVFNLLENPASSVVTGYELKDCYLNGDTITYENDMHAKIMNKFRSEAGVEIPSFSYASTLINFSSSNTQNINVTGTYTNLVNAWLLPVPQDVTANDNGVSSVDTVSTLNYKGNKYPTDLLIKLGNNGHPVNQNSNSFCSKKMQHYNACLRTALGTEKMKDVGWKLSELYKTDGWQASAGSWLRGLDQDVTILNSGVDTYGANGLVKFSFKTGEDQTAGGAAARAALIIFQYTTILKVSAGQIMLVE